MEKKAAGRDPAPPPSVSSGAADDVDGPEPPTHGRRSRRRQQQQQAASGRSTSDNKAPAGRATSSRRRRQGGVCQQCKRLKVRVGMCGWLGTGWCREPHAIAFTDVSGRIGLSFPLYHPGLTDLPMSGLDLHNLNCVRMFTVFHSIPPLLPRRRSRVAAHSHATAAGA